MQQGLHHEFDIGGGGGIGTSGDGVAMAYPTYPQSRFSSDFSHFILRKGMPRFFSKKKNVEKKTKTKTKKTNRQVLEGITLVAILRCGDVVF